MWQLHDLGVHKGKGHKNKAHRPLMISGNRPEKLNTSCAPDQRVTQACLARHTGVTTEEAHASISTENGPCSLAPALTPALAPALADAPVLPEARTACDGLVPTFLSLANPGCLFSLSKSRPLFSLVVSTNSCRVRRARQWPG